MIGVEFVRFLVMFMLAQGLLNLVLATLVRRAPDSQFADALGFVV